jgi:hypothetical protein
MIDFGLYTGYVLLIVAIATAIIFPLIYAIKTPGVFVKSLIGVGSLVVVFGISYLLSGAKITPDQAALGVTESSSRLIGAGLTMFYLALVIAFVGLVFSEINKALK